jgi:hypothetical protein
MLEGLPAPAEIAPMRCAFTRSTVAGSIVAGRALCSVAAFVLLVPSALAFDCPLSSEAIREAYFRGQHHDDSYLNAYTKVLAPPKTGPYISSMQFLTPFAQLIRLSSQHSTGYSAQQAELDHRGQQETVTMVIEIQLTDSYGPLLPQPAPPRSSSSTGYQLRSPDFWRDFEVHVFRSEKEIEPTGLHGAPTYHCSDGGCTLSGAIITLHVPAKAFDSDSATIAITPPEGDPVAVDFDLMRLR